MRALILAAAVLALVPSASSAESKANLPADILGGWCNFRIVQKMEQYERCNEDDADLIIDRKGFWLDGDVRYELVDKSAGTKGAFVLRCKGEGEEKIIKESYRCRGDLLTIFISRT
jgi:hypothetical protein